jgi:hypothetical protein
MKNLTVILLILNCCLYSLTLDAQNHALYFDGVDDKVGVLDSPELNPANSLTIEAWMNAETWAGSIWAGCILSKQGTNPDKGYGFTVGENGRIEFNHSIEENWNAVNTGQILGVNSWYHVAGVYNGTTMKLYVNGILQATLDVQGDLTLGTGVVLTIGDNPTWPGRFFNGVLDEIRIWEIARTEQEIQENMTTELTGNESGLVAYWPMNEGAGGTTADLSGNENTGTLLNMNESSWVEGFVPPGDDVGVIGIASPSLIGSGFTSEEYIKLDVKNFSTEEISGFDVSYQIDDGDIITETVNDVLPPFSSVIYTFTETVDLSGMSEVEITGFTYLEGDGNPDNDALTETISQTNDFYLFDAEQHNFGAAGQTHARSLYMPDDLSDYSEIYIHVDLECPTGGCDPWDQPAYLSIIHEGYEYEIIRYITPYGVACGGWVWDITDFRPIMTGKTDFVSIIRVWGASGWLVTMQLELVPGEPEYPYITIDRLWNEHNWVYGDPDISYDFPEKTIPIHQETQEAKIRMTMTGHGQGNTLNAAEFSNFTHHLWIDGVETFEQHLWKTDCDSNICSPQSGTWEYSRAGWCPGEDVQPWMWELNELFTAGNDMTVDFVLADYTNLLNTGYNGSSHTEPHYRCHAYLFQYSTDEFVAVDENKISNNSQFFIVYPNPSNGIFEISTKGESINKTNISLMNTSGTLIDQFEWDGKTKTFNLSDLSKGLYFMQFKFEDKLEVKKIVIQ